MANEVDRTLWVGNLSDKITEDILYELFLQAGPLAKVSIAKEKDGRKKSFAFVTFMHDVSVPYTINLMNNMSLYGKNLRLQSRPGSIHQQQQQQFPIQLQGHQRHINNPYQSNQPMPYNPYEVNQPVRNYPQQQSHPPNLHKSHTWHGDDLDQLTRDGRDQGRDSRDRDRHPNRDRDRSGNRRRDEENSRGRRHDTGPYREEYRQGSPSSRNYGAEDFDAKKQRVLHKQEQMISRYNRHSDGKSSPHHQQWQSNSYNRRGRYH